MAKRKQSGSAGSALVIRRSRFDRGCDPYSFLAPNKVLKSKFLFALGVQSASVLARRLDLRISTITCSTVCGFTCVAAASVRIVRPKVAVFMRIFATLVCAT